MWRKIFLSYNVKLHFEFQLLLLINLGKKKKT